jgi:hypothetical protein
MASATPQQTEKRDRAPVKKDEIVGTERIILTEERTRPVPWWYHALEAGVVVGPLMFLAFLVARWWWRARIWRKDADIDLQEKLDLFAVSDEEVAVFEGPDVRGVVRQLRSNVPDTFGVLDIDATVDATAAEGGLFRPVYMMQKTRRSNVVLVEQASAYDHLAHLFAYAVRRLQRDGVPAELFSFSGNLFALFPDRGKPCSIEELARQAPRDRLVIVGTGARFFDGLASELVPSVAAQLIDWPYRYFLSTRSLPEWGRLEVALFDAGFSLGTATPRGLLALAQATESQTEGPLLLDVWLTSAVAQKTSPQPTRGSAKVA